MGAGKKAEKRAVGSVGLTEARRVASINSAVVIDAAVAFGSIEGATCDDTSVLIGNDEHRFIFLRILSVSVGVVV